MEPNLILTYLGSFLLSFFIGAVPYSYLIPRIVKGVDIRNHGSGNVGASNVTRVCGPKVGVVTLLLDVGKGAAAVFLASVIGTPLTLGSGAILGHILTPFLGFSGGKGVATTVGVLAALYWPGGLIFAGIWIGATALWQYAAVSSLLATATAPLVLFLFQVDKTWIWTMGGLFLLTALTHRENIRRLISGEENKLSS